jgi:phage gp45-like
MSAIDRLHRRIRMAVGFMKITATDDTGPVHRAQVRGFPPETIDNMPVAQIYGLASHAMAGTDAVAIFASGDRSNGVIIATGNQKYRLRNLKPGEVALYDNAGNIVKLAAGGNIEITCPTKVRMITPRLEVTGDIIDHCDEQDHTDADMRTIYNSHTHRGVQPGSGNSGIPNQPQVVVEDAP